MSGTDDAGSSAAENLKAVLRKHVKHVTWTRSTNAVYDAAGTNARRICRMCQRESWLGGLVKILFEGEWLNAQSSLPACERLEQEVTARCFY